VSIGYNEQTFRTSHGGACATLGSFSHSLTGASISHVGYGSNDDEFDDCYFPGFELDARFAADEANTLVIADDTKTITAVFASAAFAPRAPTLRSASDWTFAPGEQVVIGWPHPEDFAGAYNDGLLSSVWFNNDDADDFSFMPTYQGDEIRFSIPNPAPSTGDGVVLFQFGYSTGEAVSCIGATRCSFSAERGFEHRATIKP
jgi:hypothetical protein